MLFPGSIISISVTILQRWLEIYIYMYMMERIMEDRDVTDLIDFKRDWKETIMDNNLE